MTPLEWRSEMLGKECGFPDMGDGLYGYAPGFGGASGYPFLVAFVHRSPFHMSAYELEPALPDVIPPRRWRFYAQFGDPHPGPRENHPWEKGFATRAEAVAVAEEWWRACVAGWVAAPDSAQPA